MDPDEGSGLLSWLACPKLLGENLNASMRKPLRLKNLCTFYNINVRSLLI